MLTFSSPRNSNPDTSQAPTSSQPIFAKRSSFDGSLSQNQSNDSKGQLPPPLRQEIPALPLSYAQQRLWFLDQYESNNANYNIATAWRLEGQLQRDALVQALNTIVERHAVLRTGFLEIGGEPVQVVMPQLSLMVPLLDLSTLDPAAREQKALHLAAEEALKPFDLTQAPLLRCTLLGLEEHCHVLLLTIHHIVSDGWSMGLIADEINLLYEAYCHQQPSPLLPLSIQYTDFAQWQRKWLQGDVLQKQIDYWKAHLQGAPPLLELPLDRPRPAMKRYEGALCQLSLPATLAEELKAFGRQQGATLFMVMLAAFNVLLHRYTGQDDIVVGSPIANRNRFETENLIGFFVNTLALRTDLSGDPQFTELLARVCDTTLDAYDHQDLPFERLVEALQPERSLSHSPLFQVMFALQNSPPESLELAGITVTQLEAQGDMAKFDLIVNVNETDQGYNISATYSTALFDQNTIDRLLGHYLQLLQGIAVDPQRPISDLPILTEAERHQIIVDWNATAAEFPSRDCIHMVFAEQAAHTPDKIALVIGEQRLTYGQLNARANQLAHHLRRLGVGPDVLVGISIQRSLEMVVALLGILKAGGAYVPIDAGYPEARIAYMLEDSRIEVLLTQAALKEQVFPSLGITTICLDTEWDAIAAENSTDPFINTESDNLAYIIYTSGSTGKPKGVAIPHRGVLRLVFGNEYVKLNSDLVVLHMASISFDASTFELWAPLLHGGKCVLLDEQLPTPDNLKKTIARHKVNTMLFTTALFNTIIDIDPLILAALGQVMFGGEAASAAHIETALRHLPDTRLINVYGPTECTTFATHYQVPKKIPAGMTNTPIGKPIGNTQTYVVDKHMRLLPVGISGELLIGGDGLARGYLNRPELNAEKFIPNHINPESGKHLYRSGDLVRYLPDGNIEFLDRIDQQVKIRGFRIEIGEIETVLARHPAVCQAVIISRQGPNGDRRLIAYLTPQQKATPTAAELRQYVRKFLPGYMEPAVFMIVPELPLSPTGKVDRKALPPPDQEQIERCVDLQSPANNLELQLVKIWESLLNVRPVNVEDNFFEIGGHSLLAVRVVSEINKITGQHLTVAALFHAPTIRQLAEIIQSKKWCPPWRWLVPIQPFGSRTPYFQIHGTVNVVHHLDPDQPFYELDFYGADGGKRASFQTVAQKANEFIKEIRTIQPNGPYLLGGFCFGGLLAIEIARQLKKDGEQVPLLFLIDPSVPTEPQRALFWRYRPTLAGIKALLVDATSLLRGAVKWMRCATYLGTGRSLPEKNRRFYITRLYQRAMQKHTPAPYDGPVVLYCSESQQNASDWKSFFTGEIEIHHFERSHMSLIEDPDHIQVWAECLNSCLSQVNDLPRPNHG